MSELEEWEALVEDALRIREPDQDKERRLAQLQRDITRSHHLSPIEVSELMGRIQAGRSMAVTEPCRECGIVDALGRHAGDCPRALEMGLPRLADGEDPIDPIEDYADEPEEPEPDPLLTVAANTPRYRRDNPDADPYTGLWMAYHDTGNDFDAVIYATELEALRRAVAEHWQVMALELGRSLVDQARS